MIGQAGTVPVNVDLRAEDGRSLGTAGGDGVIESLIPSGDEGSSGLLRYLDRYGDTVFNRLQAADLATELRARGGSLTNAADRESFERIATLAEHCASEIHCYLWFVGD